MSSTNCQMLAIDNFWCNVCEFLNLEQGFIRNRSRVIFLHICQMLSQLLLLLAFNSLEEFRNERVRYNFGGTILEYCHICQKITLHRVQCRFNSQYT